MRQRRRLGPALLVAALGCLALGVLLPGGAEAADGQRVQVSVDGAAFSATPTAPAFDLSGLVPGDSHTAVIGVRSGFRLPSALTVRVVDVAASDDGCTPAESAVDAGCGSGPGQLGARAEITLALGQRSDGPFRDVWTGSPDRLASGVDLPGRVAVTGTEFVRMTAALPASVGNEVQTDRYAFGVRVELTTTAGVAGVQTGPGTGGTSAGRSSAGGPLAYTGVSIALFAAGLALLLVGGALTAAARPAPR